MLGVTCQGAFVGVNLSFKSVAMVEVTFQVFRDNGNLLRILKPFSFMLDVLYVFEPMVKGAFEGKHEIQMQ